MRSWRSMVDAMPPPSASEAKLLSDFHRIADCPSANRHRYPLIAEHIW